MKFSLAKMGIDYRKSILLPFESRLSRLVNADPVHFPTRYRNNSNIRQMANIMEPFYRGTATDFALAPSRGASPQRKTFLTVFGRLPGSIYPLFF